MTHIVVDPVTRIEGHLRVEAEVDGGFVKEAWSSSTMFRGIEIILKGRDPRDAWVFTQRICGVCTTVHAIASIRAVEKAIGAVPPPNARLLRNLIMAAQNVQDHVIHFYHLHALDWVDIVSALKADPAKTAILAQSISDWPLSSVKYFTEVLVRVKAFVERGQLGIFANAYWGHPAYRLPPEANLHGGWRITWRRWIGSAASSKSTPFWAGKIRIAELSCRRHGDAGGSRLPKRAQHGHDRGFGQAGCRWVDFVTKVYLPDVLAIASYYKDWASIGSGIGNYMSYGEFPLDDNENPELLLPPGIIHARDLAKIATVEQGRIDEYISHSWYDYSVGDDKGLNPFKGETKPNYTGPKTALRKAGRHPEIQLAEIAAL